MGKLIGRDQELTRLLRLLRHGFAAVLTGEAGAGKTMLLREAARRCQRTGWRIIEINPSAATRELPLWPLYPLIPAGGAADRASLTATLRDSLATPDDQPTLLVIDDAHHLDAESIAVLATLIADLGWKVAATVRDGAPRDDTLAILWADDPDCQVPVPALEPQATGALAASVLSGEVSPTLMRWLVEASRGNPLLARELLLDARDLQTIEFRDGEWTLTDQAAVAPPGPRTRRYIHRRIGRVDDDGRRLLDLLAVAGRIRVGRLPLDLVAPLNDLEDRQLLIRRTEAGEAWVTVDHPLVGEVVLGAMDDARRWAATAALIDLIDNADPKPGDASRLAAWATTIGHPLDADRWVAATREAVANFDLDHALEWAQTAVERDRTHHGAHRSLGEVLRLRGDLSAATAALANAAATAVNEDDIAATAVDRSALVGFQRGDPVEAMVILREALDRITDPLRAMSLRSEVALFGTLMGRFDDVALIAATSSEERSAADSATRWTLGLNEIYALTMLGRVETVEELSAVLLADNPTIVGERPQELDLLLSMCGAARIQTGELAQGIAELDSALDQRRDQDQYRGIASAVLALLLDLTDDPRAAAVAAEAVAQHEWMDPFGSTPIARSVAAMVAVNDGRPAEAPGLIDSFAHDLSTADPWTTIWIGRARARAAFVAGEVEAAISLCREAGEVALQTDHRSYAAITLHDGVHYGGAAQVVAPLAEAVKDTTGAHLLELMAEHAAAVAAGAAAQVATCSQRFMAIGARRLAAEAQTQRAKILAADDLVEARRADFTGRAVSRRGVIGLDESAIVDAVSERELEVAKLAAHGRTSAEIAAAVYLSKRTVDNHLHSVYRKLDLAGRNDLAPLLL